MSEYTTTTWRTSSYSGANNNCVQIGATPPPTILTLVRDSKNPSGGVLAFESEVWQTFLHALKDDAFGTDPVT
jgi:hypothetical protein